MIRLEGKKVYDGQRDAEKKEVEESVLNLKVYINHLQHVLQDMNSYDENAFLNSITDDFLDNRITVIERYSDLICREIESLKMGN